MDNKNQMETHSRPNLLYPPVAPKVLFPSSGGFTRVPAHFYQERPMTLNAWTQTTNEDAEYLRAEHHHHEQNQQFQESENERRLLEKIRILEETLRIQSELLSQIHATSGGGSRGSIQLQQQQFDHSDLNISAPNSTSIDQSQQEPKETIKYTIIAEAGSINGNDEPIEIHLAEDDGALNLNSSADSERLEIYIADEQVGIKSETLKSEESLSQTPVRSPQPPTPETKSVTEITRRTAISPQSTQLAKRRKIDMKASSSSSARPSPSSDVHTNHQGFLKPINMQSSAENSSSYIVTKRNVLSPMAAYSNTNSTPLSEPPHKKENLKIKRNIMRSSSDDKLSKNERGIERAMVSIGPNNTLIPEEVYASIPWKSASIATRRLLMTIFDRTTLATHSMTGKPSPAFKDQNKPLKKMLDRTKVEDILYAVTTKCNVTEKEVRNAITTKCADENKMMKLQMGKNHHVNKENTTA